METTKPHRRATANWQHPNLSVKRTDTNPTTRSQPPFIYPTPKNLIKLYQFGTTITNTNIKHTTQTLTNLLIKGNAGKDRINYGAAQVMSIIHEYNDIAVTIMSMQPQGKTQQCPRNSDHQSHGRD